METGNTHPCVSATDAEATAQSAAASLLARGHAGRRLSLGMAAILAAVVAVLGLQLARSMVMQTVTIDGTFNDWANVLGDADNVEFDSSKPGDKDFSTLQSADRDIVRYASTWDSQNLYFYFKRSSSGTNNLHFLIYLDRNDDGVLTSTDYVLDFGIDNNGLKNPAGYYYVPSGGVSTTDPVTGDGVSEPGGLGSEVTGVGAAMQGSVGTGAYDDVEVELAVSWASLGISPGSALRLHASTSRNLNLPSGVEDNVRAHTTSYSRLALSPNRDGAAAPSSVVTYTHTLAQTANVTDTIALSATSAEGWGTRIANAAGSTISTVTLRGNESTTVLLAVTVPSTATAGAVDAAYLTAVSGRKPDVQSSVIDRTYAGQLVVYPDRSATLATGTALSYPHYVANRTDATLTVDLSSYSWSLPAWGVGVYQDSGGLTPTSTVVVPPGSQVPVFLRVSTPATAAVGTVDVSELRGVARENPAYSDHARDVTTIRRRVDIRPDREDSTVPGSVITYRHTVTNSWGTTQSIDVTGTSSRGWQVIVYGAEGTTPTSSFTLGPTETTETVVRVVVPYTATVGQTDSTTVTASWATSSTVRDIAVDRTYLVNLSTYADPGFRSPSELFRLGDTVYAQGGGLSLYSGSGVNFRWRYPSSQQATLTAALSVIKEQAENTYSVATTEPVGNWTVSLVNPSGGTTITTTTFTVTYDADILDLRATDAASANDTVYVDSTLRNNGVTTITASTVRYVVWWDANGDDVFGAGDQCIDSSGAPVSYGGTSTVSTHETTGVAVSPGATFGESGNGWGLPNRDFQYWGVYRVSASWETSGGVLIDDAETTFFSPGESPEVTIDKRLATGQAAIVGLGQTVAFDVGVRNSGDSTLTTLPLRDWFDSAYLQYASATPSPSSVSSGTLDWSHVATLAPGAGTTVTVSFVTTGAPTSGIATNSAECSGALDASALMARRVSDIATVTLDAVAPDVSVTGVANGASYNTTRYPDATSTDPSATVSATLNGNPFTLGSAVATEGAYTLIAVATDPAGNAATETVSFTIDLTPPSGTMLVDNGAAFTTTTTVSIDSTVTGAVEMRIDTGSGFGAWIPYAGSVPATLTSGDGTKTVTAEYRDAAGNVLTLTDDIVLDTTPPAAPTLAAEPSGPSIVVTWTASAEPGVTGYNLYRSTSPTGPFSLVTTSPVPGTTYTDEDIDFGVTYYYAVAAVTAGGEGTRSNVDEAVVPQSTDRLWGDDRIETAVDISRSTFTTAPTVILATMHNFADALAAGPLAASYEGPLLLTSKSKLLDASAAEIERLGATEIIIVGGQAAVGEEVAVALRGKGLTVDRIGGADRYETAVLIAHRLKQREGSEFSLHAFVARGDQFPDALSISPAAYNLKAPILLVRQTSVPSPVVDFLADNDFEMITVLGSAAAVSTPVQSQVASITGATTERVGGGDRYETSALISNLSVERGWSTWTYFGMATGTNWPDALAGGVGLGKRNGVLVVTPPTSLHPQASGLIITNKPRIYEVIFLGGPAALSDSVRTAVEAILLP